MALLLVPTLLEPIVLYIYLHHKHWKIVYIISVWNIRFASQPIQVQDAPTSSTAIIKNEVVVKKEYFVLVKQEPSHC